MDQEESWLSATSCHKESQARQDRLRRMFLDGRKQLEALLQQTPDAFRAQPPDEVYAEQRSRLDLEIRALEDKCERVCDENGAPSELDELQGCLGDSIKARCELQRKFLRDKDQLMRIHWSRLVQILKCENHFAKAMESLAADESMRRPLLQTQLPTTAPEQPEELSVPQRQLHQRAGAPSPRPVAALNSEQDDQDADHRETALPQNDTNADVDSALPASGRGRLTTLKLSSERLRRLLQPETYGLPPISNDNTIEFADLYRDGRVICACAPLTYPNKDGHYVLCCRMHGMLFGNKSSCTNHANGSHKGEVGRDREDRFNFFGKRIVNFTPELMRRYLKAVKPLLAKQFKARKREVTASLGRRRGLRQRQSDGSRAPRAAQPPQEPLARRSAVGPSDRSSDPDLAQSPPQGPSSTGPSVPAIRGRSDAYIEIDAYFDDAKGTSHGRLDVADADLRSQEEEDDDDDEEEDGDDDDDEEDGGDDDEEDGDDDGPAEPRRVQRRVAFSGDNETSRYALGHMPTVISNHRNIGSPDASAGRAPQTGVAAAFPAHMQASSTIGLMANAPPASADSIRIASTSPSSSGSIHSIAATANTAHRQHRPQNTRAEKPLFESWWTAPVRRR